MYENVYPNCTCPPNYPSTPTVTAGQFVYVDVTWVSPNAQYFLENVTTGSYHTYYQTTSHHDTTSGEAVMEDKTFSQSCGSGGCTSNFVTYNSMTFYDVYVLDLNSNQYSMDTLSVDKFKMGWSSPLQVYMAPCALQANGVFSITSTC